MVSHDRYVWFFKLRAPALLVAEHKKSFDQFIRSVRFTDEADQPIMWTVPKGWRQVPGHTIRYATFQLGSDKTAPQLIITRLTAGQGTNSVLLNVNRWRREDLGLEEITAEKLAGLTKKVKLGDEVATLVDMKGPGPGQSRMDLPLAGRMGAPEARPTVKYDTPKGWDELAEPGEMRVATFAVKEDGQVADVGIAAFPGMPGGLLRNINRWRDKVKLGPITADQLDRELHEMEVAGQPAVFVDYTGPAGERGPERLLGVIARHGAYSWFFTMKGPADLVGSQKSTFKTFVKSVRFDGGKGDNHE
jgi:hypothetical protein